MTASRTSTGGRRCRVSGRALQEELRWPGVRVEFSGASAGGGKTQACQPPMRDTFGSGNVYYVEIQLLQANGQGCFYPMTIPNATFAKGEISKLKPLNQDNVKHPAVRRQ